MRIFRGLRIPDPVSSGKPVKASDHNAILAALEWLARRADENRIMPSPDIGVKSRSAGGTIAYLKHRLGSGGATPAAGPCFFGEIIKYSETVGSADEPTEKTGIRGGWLKAGKKNWRVENREINLESAGVFPVWIRVAVTANTDSEGIATLSGLKTSEEPVWEHGAGSDDYPDTEIPAQFPLTDAGAGVAIVPIGVLTVADGAASLVPVGCGNIILTHCPGNLDHLRGPLGTGSGSGSDA